MTKHWSTIAIGEMSETCLGKMLDKNKNKGEFYPYLANKNVQWGSFGLSDLSEMRFEEKEFERYSLKYGDLVICEGGEPGRCAIWYGQIPEIKIQKALHRLRVKEGFDSEFLYYSFLHAGRINFLDRYFIGSTIKHLTGVVLKKIRFKFPGYDEQQKIAKVLSDLDAKIELNNKINAELEAMAKLMYDYWFVQFDFPNEDGKPYKSSGGKMVWNEELKREIPDGWRNGTIDDIADLVRGVTYNKHDIKSNNHLAVTPILRATNITGNTIDLKDMVYVPDEFVSVSQVLNKFDVLITMSSGSIDHIGKNGMFYFDEKVAFGAFCAKLVAKFDFKFYLFSYTQSEFMSATIKNQCLGTNINNLNGSLVKGFKLVLPDENILRNYNKNAQAVYSKIAVNQKENQKLTELRDWLLPMLMNGQVKVVQQPIKVFEEVHAGYKKQSSVQLENYKKIQILYSTIWANSLINVKQGEMATAKDVYLLDRISGLNTGFKFAQNNWGAFDPKEKQLLNTKQYFHKPRFPNSEAFYIDLKDNGELLNKIPEELKSKISQGIHLMNEKVFKRYFGTQKAEKKELFATVLKCIEDNQTLELIEIREAMENWKIKQGNKLMTKAEKFSELETKEALQIIVAENWYVNVYKRGGEIEK